MTQYQSFPETPGDSRTLDKLKALHLPELGGRRFLDVGCNEGFFCGFAQFQGADQVVGIDHSAAFIERARARFPGCQFLQQGWETLPDGEFDVILLASALHYAQDQPGLIRRLVGKLSTHGVLVLELGIAGQQSSQWVNVERGIDERSFPTMAKLREVLADYAWKWIGPSVDQDGDPVGRHVIHINRRLPVAYLLMLPPGYGKTSIASHLFPQAGVKVVSGDQQILLAARGTLAAAPALQALLTRDFSPFRIDQSIRRVFDSGLGPALVDLWRQQVEPGESFALDAYVPPEHQHIVEGALADAGYFPVNLRWDRPGPRIPEAPVAAAQAEEYYFSLVQSGSQARGATCVVKVPEGGLGHVDEYSLSDQQLVIRGWAVTAGGAPLRVLRVTLGGQAMLVEGFERQSRPDVQKHLDLPHSLFGYRARVTVPGGGDAQALLRSLEVRAGDSADRMGAPLPFAVPPGRR